VIFGRAVKNAERNNKKRGPERYQLLLKEVEGRAKKKKQGDRSK